MHCIIASSLAPLCLRILYEMGTLSSVSIDTLLGGSLQDIIHPSSFLRPAYL